MPNKIGTYLYNSLPSIYKTRDEETQFTLKRYLNALGEPMTDIEFEIKNILTLLDVEKMDAKYLPFFASMFGITYNYDISEDYQRKYLANLVDIQKRKGTKEVLEFTARELTGMDATVIDGQALTFKTWSPNNSTGAVTSRKPKTYSKRNRINYYFAGGETCDRFTVTVILTTEGHIDGQELFLNTQLISRLTKDLVQPYIKLRYKAHAVAYLDEYTSNIVEEDIIRIVDKDTYKSTNITEIDKGLRSKDVFEDTYNKNISENNLYAISFNTDNDLYTSDINDYELLAKMEIREESTVTVNVKTRDNIRLSPSMIDEENIPANISEGDNLNNVHIGVVSENIQPVIRQEQSGDYIHLANINDIINLSDMVIESHEDVADNNDKKEE